MARQQIVVAIALTFCCALPGWAQTAGPSVIVVQQPIWSDLSVPQKIVLAPLSDEWDSMESLRQKKWLGIAARFAAMNAEEQRRLQGQMQEWGRLTPGERQIAREIYKNTSQLPVEKRQELKQKWEEYSSLPDAEKEKLKQLAEGQSTAKNIRPLPALTPLTVPVTVTPPGTPINTSVSAASPSTTAPTEPAGTETPQKQ